MASGQGKSRRHAHLKKRPDDDGFTRRMSHKTCDTCGKCCYLTRSEAKKAAKVNHPGQVMHEYECAEPSGKVWWHLSSIPAGKLKELRKRGNHQ